MTPTQQRLFFHTVLSTFRNAPIKYNQMEVGKLREYTKEAKAFYHTKAWELCRKTYLQKVGGLCERCLAMGEYKPAKIVHHKVYIATDNINNPEITLNHDNLEALCLDCHNKEHIGRNKRYKVTPDGELIMRE